MGVSQSHEDTIVAVASPHGPGERGIIRLSGPRAIDCVRQVFRPENESDFTAKHKNAVLPGSISLDGTSVPGTLLIWPTVKSFTRQPSAEFHTFGSVVLLEMIVQTLCQHGARPAQPGEFTMRAFLSGRLDLTQAEAVLAVIDAKNRKQLDVAIDQLAGGIGAGLGQTKDELVAALAELEAGLDFVEEDIEFISSDAMIEKLCNAKDSLSALIDQISSRESRNEYPRVSLFGLPNAGKSSLFNRLIEKELAIVSELQGTTTDRVSSALELESQIVELVDTAGLEAVNAEASIAAASQNQRTAEIRQCDIALVCVCVADTAESIAQQLNELNEFKNPIVVLTQIDRVEESKRAEVIETVRRAAEPVVAVSSESGYGISFLRQSVLEAVRKIQTSESAIVGSTLLRTGQSLRDAFEAIQSAIDAAKRGIGEEVIASEVRLALDCIGVVVGTIYTDDVLDVVFGKFCIGK